MRRDYHGRSPALHREVNSRHDFGAVTLELPLTVSGLEPAHIGSPFWALVLGLGASRLLERDAVRRTPSSEG